MEGLKPYLQMKLIDIKHSDGLQIISLSRAGYDSVRIKFKKKES